MNQPQKPPEPPAEGAPHDTSQPDTNPTDTNPTGTTPNGIPDGIEEQEPKGWPSSDRHGTETVPNG
jgi:hypothetical protein